MATSPVPQDIQRLISEITDGWEIPEGGTRQVSELFWGDVDLSKGISELQPADGHSEVIREFTPDEEIFQDFVSRDWKRVEKQFGKSLRGRLSDGTTFVAETGVLVSLTTEGKAFRGCLRADYWSILPVCVPSLWVGEINGMSRFLSSNILISNTKSTEACLAGLLLEGTYDYYLIRVGSKEKWYLIINTNNAGLPDRATLYREFEYLQFVLGSQMSALRFCGIDGHAFVVSAEFGGDYGTSTISSSSHPPVPLNDIRANWAPVFFRRLVRINDQRIKEAIWYYLRSFTDGPEVEYLILHVALESLAFSYTTQEETVKDKTAWKEWVAAQAPAIRSMAKAGFEESLVGKVRACGGFASGRLVADLFQRHGLSVTKKMKGELQGRNFIVHQGSIVDRGSSADETDESTSERISLVRCMLVATIAKLVGYEGMIMGWERGTDGRLESADPDWWIVSEEAQAEAEADAIEISGGNTSSKMPWPSGDSID